MHVTFARRGWCELAFEYRGQGCDRNWSSLYPEKLACVVDCSIISDDRPGRLERRKTDMDGLRRFTSSCSACSSESDPSTSTTATTITTNADTVDPMSPLKMIDDLFTTWKTKTMEVVHHHPVFVKDTSKYWYKPQISREETIAVLKDKQPGSFIIRDSSSFPGAFGLALKVATAPPGVLTKGNSDGSELVRHFLIETTAKGVKLKGCNNEPVFGSLAALVYQHSITPLALPCKLLLPEYDPAVSVEQVTTAQQLLEQGAGYLKKFYLIIFCILFRMMMMMISYFYFPHIYTACNVTYLYSNETESLTGPEAIRRTVDSALVLSSQKKIEPLNVHFKVSSQGITITDNARKVFFRRHYPVQTITHCGLDPENRQWCCNSNSGPARIYGFVARKSLAKSENVCHLFAELEPEQPASAIVNFVNKVIINPNRL
ncbi:Tensin [Trichinella pseudospiralis]|uniref:Tensin n=1 Tax=Trichinella pseudospiralis TaxID=6337 RepID=A0A0V1IH48_TRIPS|nr:Tensin [Trichinella pseudospiralis]